MQAFPEHLDNLILKYIEDNGAISATLGYNGFPKACAYLLMKLFVMEFLQNHYPKEGDIVNIDVTTILNGYYGDTSTMFLIGNVSDEAMKLVEATKHCLNLGIQQVKPGIFW